MKFRKDINGLRAIAVIAVVLFHFNPNWMPGGFAGVDVFFVISGFLMTGIIFKGLEKSEFSIYKFYIARANRIVPALALLCIVLLIFGWFLLSPNDYKALAKHTLSSVTFLSNNTYWLESGYFDSSSKEKWLIHTWSLSVEWQFYIIYPIILVLLNKLLPLKMTKRILLIGTIIGFAFSVLATFKWPTASYFLFPTRAWEMMIGGIAYLYPFKLNDKKKKVLETIGILSILTSYFFITKEIPWPGYMSIFPVLGTFLTIQAYSKNSFITGNILFQNLGSWSYSIYLWHWPLVVAISYFSLNRSFVYLGIILSVFLGYLCWNYIEKLKFEKTFKGLGEAAKYGPIQATVLVGLISGLIYITNGAEYHYSKEVLIANNEASNMNPYNCINSKELICNIGNKLNIRAIIIGDSHAEAITTSLSSIFNLDNEGIISITKSACPFIINSLSTKSGDECYKENNKRKKFLNENYHTVPVFWVARTGVYLYGQSNPKRINNALDIKPSIYFTEPQDKFTPTLYKEFEENLKLTFDTIVEHHPVYIVKPIPEMRKNIPKTLTKNLLLNIKDSDLSIDYSLYLERNEAIIKVIDKLSTNEKVNTLDPTKYLCKSSKCIAHVNNRPIYFDGDHLSEYGNKLLIPMFEAIYMKTNKPNHRDRSTILDNS